MNRRDFDHIARTLNAEYRRNTDEGFTSAALGVKFAANTLAVTFMKRYPSFDIEDFDRFMGHFAEEEKDTG
jgi:hypothetical protein